MDSKKSIYEASSEKRAEELFRENEDAALCGSQGFSAETDQGVRDGWLASPNRKKSKMVFDLAKEQPERFLELTAFLPHAIQDIFYQYFLLGRTQVQIGSTLDMSQTGVWQALEIGIDAIAAISLFNGPPTERDSWHAGYQAYQNMLNFKTGKESRKTLLVHEPTALGSFIIRTSDPNIEEHFSPTTPDGPV